MRESGVDRAQPEEARLSVQHVQLIEFRHDNTDVLKKDVFFTVKLLMSLFPHIVFISKIA